MASKYLQKYPVPQSFPNILEDFAKELLRDQPENIYEFGFLYFKSLEEGKPFDYKRKGKAIPPPKDRLPSAVEYKFITPSADSYIEHHKKQQHHFVPHQSEHHNLKDHKEAHSQGEEHKNQHHIIDHHIEHHHDSKIQKNHEISNQTYSHLEKLEEHHQVDNLEVKYVNQKLNASKEESDATSYVEDLLKRTSPQSRSGKFSIPEEKAIPRAYNPNHEEAEEEE